ALCDDFVAGRWQGWLLPAAILASAIFESAVIAVYFASWAGWLVPLILFFATVAALGLALMRLVPPLMNVGAHQVLIVALVALLAAPVLWSTTPLNSGDVALPHAGPDIIHQSRPDANFANYTELVNYLQTNSSGETYLAAAQNANTAAPIILLTGRPVMAIGGFTGSDPILTTQEFADYVAQGKLRFVLLNDDRRGGQQIAQWVQTSCNVVDSSLWRGSTNAPMKPGPGGRLTLYDCK